MTLHAAALEACDHMESTLEALKDSRDVSVPAPTAQQLQAATEQVKTEAAKLGFLFSQPGAPSTAEAESLLKSFLNAALMACSVIMHAGGVYAGPTLRKVSAQTAEILINSCTDLVRAAFQGGDRPNHADVVVRSAGMCIERSALAAKAPLDNKTAIGRAITLVGKQVTDAVEELKSTEETSLQQRAEEEQQGNGNGAHAEEAAAEDEEEEFSDDEFGGGPLSTSDLSVLRAVVGILKSIQELLRGTLRELIAADTGAMASAETVERWESVLFHIQQLRAPVDDLGAGCYPPQDHEELASAAEALVNGCELMVEDAGVEGVRGAVAGLEEAKTALLALIAGP